MQYKRLVAALLAVALWVAAMGQKALVLNHLDSLIGQGEYAEAYPLAQEQYRRALPMGGTEALRAAFRLTALDYAYSPSPDDSALVRYALLSRQLRGVDRAVAYTFRYGIYRSLYESNYRFTYNPVSDDPLLPVLQWHLGRVEDTLLACADSVLAYAPQLRALGPDAWCWMQDDEAVAPVVDSSLFGILLQSLLDIEPRRHVDLSQLGPDVREGVLMPFEDYRLRAEADSTLPFALRLHRRVAQACHPCPADMMLWLDLRRLDDCYGEGMTQAVDRLAAHYASRIASAEMRAWLAYHRASCYSHADRMLEAEQFCLAAEREWPGTCGARQCASLRQYICRPELAVRYDATQSSLRDRLAVVEGRNVGWVDFRLVAKDLVPDSLRWSCHLADSLRTLPATREWRQLLPAGADHLWHRHLVALPAVPQGDYYLLALADSLVCYGSYQSADAAFITYDYGPTAGKSHYLSPSAGHLVDRLTGAPLAGRRVTLHLRGEMSGHAYRHRCRTDAEGYFQFPTHSVRYAFKGADHLSAMVDGYEYESDSWMQMQSYHRSESRQKIVDIVMLDRPVYRLGDTVHFCAVAYARRVYGEEWREEAKSARGVELEAIFGRRWADEADTLRLTTDGHGRCWGSFVVPKDGMNGKYTLELREAGNRPGWDDHYYGFCQVDVDAYRQPHFAVSLSTTPASVAPDSAGSTRRFGQPITVYGVATSFSGAPMGGAKVRWEVSRERMVSLRQMNSIANDFPHADSLTVADDGLFQFSFTPRADSGTFIYTAYVRVTDADGELHEQQLSFHVSDRDGYCAPVGDNLGHLAFVYNNFDHQPLPGAVRVELYELRQPDTLRHLDTLQKQYPDAQWVGTRDEFRRRFPHLAFTAAEADPRQWPVVAKRLDQSTTGRRIEAEGLPSGLYRVRFTTPDGAVHDTLVNHIAPGGRVTGTDLVWVRTSPARKEFYDSPLVRVGDTVRVEMGSPYGRQPVYYCVSHNAKVYRRGMLMLDSSHTTTLEIPVASSMDEDFLLTLAAMRDGRAFDDQYAFRVANSGQRLSVDIATFRNRLQPGEREQWQLSVASADSLGGRAGQGVEANLCLSLYDRSLEEFGFHHYGFWPWSGYSSWMRVGVGAAHSAAMNGKRTSGPRAPEGSSLSKPPVGFALPVASMYCRHLVRHFNPYPVSGTVVDGKTGEVLPFVSIVVRRNGVKVDGVATDLDGNFHFEQLPAGVYELDVNAVGYNRHLKTLVIKGSDRKRVIISLRPGSIELEEVEIVQYKIPVIDIGAPQSGLRLTSDDIARMPGTNVRGLREAMVPKEAIAEVQARLNFGGAATEDLPSPRTNLSTLALFTPALRTDAQGRAEVAFTLPDALTQWRLHGLAWTDGFEVGNIERTLQTQKELMVQPLLPRFLRVGDTTEIRAKVSNLADSALPVVVELTLNDTSWHKRLTVGGHSSAVASFRVAVEAHWRVADYVVMARAATAQGHRSDGERGQLPVLKDRERVTQSHLVYVGGSASATEPSGAAFNLPVSGADSVSIAFCANPMQYAIQALPHFGRHRMPGNLYLANSIYVNHLWSTLAPLADSERKHLASRVRNDLRQLLGAQAAQGGWSWMPSGKEPSLYITALVLERLAAAPELFGLYKRDYQKAVRMLDNALARDYQAAAKSGQIHLGKAEARLDLLYARSLYLDQMPLVACDSLTREAYGYYYQLCRLLPADELPLMAQGRLALLMHRMGDTAEAVRLARRIKGAARADEERGMYWVGNTGGYGRWQRPVEAAALMVDVFADVLHDWPSVGRIQQWILASRHGTSWRTDMATACAVAALLRQPVDGSRPAGEAVLTVNGSGVETGGDSVAVLSQPLPDTLRVLLANPTPYPAWGAVFCSREIPLDSIRYGGTGITLRKTFSRVGSNGSAHLLGPDEPLRVGDHVRVHIDIRCDRDLERMVLSDQRAAAFEPVSTASGWRWNGGLSYYVDVRDDRLDCYIDCLGEGHYYVEYDLWVRHAGVFATGIGTLRSAYAPEFRASTPSVVLRIL